jgi:hypothetical protein
MYSLSGVPLGIPSRLLWGGLERLLSLSRLDACWAVKWLLVCYVFLEQRAKVEMRLSFYHIAVNVGLLEQAG